MPRRASRGRTTDRNRVRKSIYDPIHGTLTLEGAALDLVGDPSFQRLWGIRQTGLAHLVFPGANHTRLEHSLGVYAVARKMSDALDLEPADAALVEVGGLLHDLGHAPLSHTLDGPMREVLGVSHEQRTRSSITGLGDGGPRFPGAPASRVAEILERHGIPPVRVADLVDPPNPRAPSGLLRAMLHGPVDADRIDYLQRDAYYTGVAHGAIDAVRLLATVQAFGDRFVFAEKGRDAVEGFLVGRSLMYSAVYFHKTVRSAEVMAQAAVERYRGYPSAARPLFDGADGDLFAALERSGGRSAELLRALRMRRLFRRVGGRRRLGGPGGSELARLERDPERRRAREDELSERARAPPGSVLIDLSGIARRGMDPMDWSEVGILEGRRVRYPFRRSGFWQAVTVRPPSHWPVSVYADRRYEARARALVRRDPILGG